MKAMQCELCGSTDILKDGDYFVCQNCGTKYTPENAKKMMVEGVVQVEGTVKVDASNQVANYLELGTRRARLITMSRQRVTLVESSNMTMEIMKHG